jgi:predicted ester cyclase
MVAEGDKVVIRYTGLATDTEGLMGQSPTGKVTRTAAIQIFRIADGQIAESWAMRDDLGALRQLGHLPAAHPST